IMLLLLAVGFRFGFCALPWLFFAPLSDGGSLFELRLLFGLGDVVSVVAHATRFNVE
ncbi:hypothetical protein A2U01_0027443, partial [Trifolium medium]|nr:hypothetical protein [Trifolium medium]